MIQRYDMRQYHDDPPEMAEDARGEYVLYSDYERIKARSDRLEALILKALDLWWPFAHGAHASDRARNLRKELSDAIQPQYRYDGDKVTLLNEPPPYEKR